MRTRAFKILPVAWLVASSTLWANAAGTGDPTYRDVLARAHPVGIMVDWKVRLTGVSKLFFTYTMAARVVPDPGQTCDRCDLTVVYQGPPQDLARPAIYRAGEVVAIRGVVMTTRPHIRVLASAVNPR